MKFLLGINMIKSSFEHTLTFTIILQVNFFADHSKLVISVDGQDYLVAYIDEDRQIVCFRLLQIQHFGCSDVLRVKLQYAREMLEGVISHDGEAV